MDSQTQTIQNLPASAKAPQVPLTPSTDLLEAARRSDNLPAGWTEVECAVAYHRYLKWLALKLQHPESRFAPTRDIDFFWHLHMLAPVAYNRDCLRWFGRLLDHDGGFGKGPGELPRLKKVYEQTARWWEETYGEPYREDGRWLQETVDCWHDCQDRCWHACAE